MKLTSSGDRTDYGLTPDPERRLLTDKGALLTAEAILAEPWENTEIPPDPQELAAWVREKFRLGKIR